LSVQPTGVAWPEPADRPAKRHWWSIQPPPPAEPISARRGYAQVLIVYAAFFLAPIIEGGETLALRLSGPSGSWAVFVPGAVSQLGLGTLAILVAIPLSASRGITPRMLGFSLPRRRTGKAAVGSTFRAGVWALMALLAGSLITGALETGHFPQPAHQDLSYVLYGVASSMTAGIVEETIALAFVVTTLRQARRPVPEILVVAVLLRCAYHDYYGPGVVGIAVWAAVFIWLFLRTGSVIPLIVVHALWDAWIFVGEQHALRTAFGLAALLAFVVLPVAAGITWLVEVLNRKVSSRPPPGAGPFAGPTFPPYPPGQVPPWPAPPGAAYPPGAGHPPTVYPPGPADQPYG